MKGKINKFNKSNKLFPYWLITFIWKLKGRYILSRNPRTVAFGQQIGLDYLWLTTCPRDHVPETKRILFLGDEGSLSEFVDLKELLSGRTWILSGPRLIQLIKFRIVSGTIESLFHCVTTSVTNCVTLLCHIFLFKFEMARVVMKLRNKIKWFALRRFQLF